MSKRKHPSRIFVQPCFFPLCIEFDPRRKKLGRLQYRLIGTKKTVGETDPSLRRMDE